MFTTAMTRREMLWQSGGGLGGIALASLLGTNQATAATGGPGGLAGLPHHTPRAKRVIQLFMAGAASHVDLFDYKPELIKRHGQEANFGEKVEAFQNGLGPWLKPIWQFKPYGQSGKMLADIVAPLGSVADEIAFVHNMVGKTGVHSQSTYLQATGFQNPGYPGMGCWVSYGLVYEPEPAHLCGSARPSRVCQQWSQELGQRLSAHPASGHHPSSGFRKPH